MPSTGIDLQPQWFDEPTLMPYWWIISIPVWYCNHPDKAVSNVSMNFATGSTWLGPTMWDGVAYANKSSGIKYAYSVGASGTDNGNHEFKWFNSQSMGTVELKPLNTGSTYGPYNNEVGEWDRPGTYQVGLARDPLFFGPYQLSKTGDAGAPIPQEDGDVLIIINGDDVLGGASGSEGTPYDQRVYNLLFYSTGSAQAQNFLASQTGAVFNSFQNFQDVRGGWANLNGHMIFVAASSSMYGPPSLTWWPLNHADMNGDPLAYQVINANNAS